MRVDDVDVDEEARRRLRLDERQDRVDDLAGRRVPLRARGRLAPGHGVDDRAEDVDPRAEAHAVVEEVAVGDEGRGRPALAPERLRKVPGGLVEPAPAAERRRRRRQDGGEHRGHGRPGPRGNREGVRVGDRLPGQPAGGGSCGTAAPRRRTSGPAAARRRRRRRRDRSPDRAGRGGRERRRRRRPRRASGARPSGGLAFLALFRATDGHAIEGRKGVNECRQAPPSPVSTPRKVAPGKERRASRARASPPCWPCRLEAERLCSLPAAAPPPVLSRVPNQRPGTLAHMTAHTKVCVAPELLSAWQSHPLVPL